MSDDLTVQRVKHSFTVPASTTSVLPRDLASVLHTIHAHLFEAETNAARILALSKLSNHNVTTRFKLRTGYSIKEYIEHHRLLAARTLLADTNLAVYVIADTIGYEYVETFDRAFRRHVGMTPTAYRVSCREAML